MNFVLVKVLSFIVIVTFSLSCTKTEKKAMQSEPASESLICGSESASDSALFQYAGKSYKATDLPIALRQMHYDVEREQYERVKGIVDSAVIGLYMQQESEKQKKSKEEIEKELIAVAEPSEQQLKEWYEKNKARIPYPFEQIKSEIARIVKGEEENQKRQALVSKIQSEGSFKLLLPAPVSPSSEINVTGYPTKGAADAKVKIVEFSDYQCGHCKAASEILKTIIKKNEDKVQFVHMDFPLQNAGLSFDHAVASHCADEQGKYWEFHHAVFATPSLSAETPKKIAEELKLDIPKFEACLKSDAAKKKVEVSRSEGDRLGISGTPSIYVNGRKITGYSAETLQAEIDSALKG